MNSRLEVSDKNTGRLFVLSIGALFGCITEGTGVQALLQTTFLDFFCLFSPSGLLVKRS